MKASHEPFPRAAERLRRPARHGGRRSWPASPLVRSLERFVPLTRDEAEALGALAPRLFPYEARADLIEEGTVPARDVIVISGYACRYKLRPGGERQILQILLPGEICHAHAHLQAAAAHGVCALTELYAARPPREALLRLADRHPRIGRALSLAALAERAMLLEWIAASGRPAESRLAHLLCELKVRMAALGLAEDERALPPFTQVQLAQALGLTVVHLNRLVQKLRREGLIELANRSVAIADFERLKALGEFDPAYLRLGKTAAA